MKLLLDSLKAIFRVLFYLLVVMTVLAAGAKILPMLRHVADEALCTIDECEATVASREALLRRATATYQAAVADAEHAVETRRAQLERARTTAGSLVQSLASARDRTLQAVVQEFAELGLEPSIASVAPAARNHQVVTLCVRSTGWDGTRCQRVFSNVPSATTLSTDAWAEATSDAIDVACSPGMADPSLEFQSWIGLCQPKQLALRAMFVVYAGLARAGDAWAENNVLVQDALARTAALEAEIRALLDAPIASPDIARAQAAQVEAQHALDQARAYLREANEDPWRVGYAAIDRYWLEIRPFFWSALALLLLGAASRPFAYFVLAPLIRCAGRLYVLPPSPTTDVVEDASTGIVRSTTPAAGSDAPNGTEDAMLVLEPGIRQQHVRLGPDETLWVRPDYVATSQGGSATFIYGGWQHPFTSYAVGLTGMTTFSGASRSKVSIGGTDTQHTDEYIGVIRLQNHPGVVIRPHHLVAVHGDVRMRFRWHFSLVAWLRGQIRYAVASGTGALFVRGYGGVFPQAVGDPNKGRAEMVPRDQLNDGLLVGWDARLGVSLERNENWIHVALLHRGEMFETSLSGEGAYVQSQSAPPAGSPGALGGVSRLFDAVLGAIGKILGL